MALHPRVRLPCRGRRVLAALVALTLTTPAWHACAVTFTVNSAADTTDGTCGPAVGQCTLREAIQAAVATVGRDTIVFDPGVFPHGSGVAEIKLSSPLPMIADPAGTVIDGTGATILINGGLSVSGLVFASAPGVPLMKVTVANLFAGSFTGTAVQICGGVPPDCDADVSGVLVKNVSVTQTGGDGIRIEGRVVSKARVVESATSRTDGPGIRLFATQSLTGARVAGCTVRASGDDGILLRALERIVGATVVDSVAAHNDGVGLALSSQDVTKATLTHVVAADNDGVGIQVRATRNNSGTKLTHVVATGNGNTGIEIIGDTVNTKAVLKGVVADRNDVHGVAFIGPTTGAKITGATMLGSGDAGLGFADNTTGTKVSRVTTSANEVTGVYIYGGGGNVLQQVVASANGDAGMLLLENGGHTVEKSTAAANGVTGIGIRSGSTGNVVQKNVALGNGTTDLYEGNPGCGGDTWKSNVFRTGNDPCLQ